MVETGRLPTRIAAEYVTHRAQVKYARGVRQKLGGRERTFAHDALWQWLLR